MESNHLKKQHHVMSDGTSLDRFSFSAKFVRTRHMTTCFIFWRNFCKNEMQIKKQANNIHMHETRANCKFQTKSSAVTHENIMRIKISISCRITRFRAHQFVPSWMSRCACSTRRIKITSEFPWKNDFRKSNFHFFSAWHLYEAQILLSVY